MYVQKAYNKGLVQPSAGGLNTAMTAGQPATPPALTVIDGTHAQTPAHFRGLLIAVGQRQDREAFAALFSYFAPRIKSFLMKGGANPDQADELAQETMIAVWQKASSFDPAKASPSTWIFTIARNKRIDALRKTPRPEMDANDLDLPDTAPNAGDDLLRDEETDIMAEAIRDLPPDQADLLYKSFFEDKTHADIAKETSLPLGTVKSRIRLALERLRGNKNITELRP